MDQRGQAPERDDRPKRGRGAMTASGHPDGSRQREWIDDDRSFHVVAGRDELAVWMRTRLAERMVVVGPARGAMTFEGWLEQLRQERALTARPAEEVEDEGPAEQW